MTTTFINKIIYTGNKKRIIPFGVREIIRGDITSFIHPATGKEIKNGTGEYLYKKEGSNNLPYFLLQLDTHKSI